MDTEEFKKALEGALQFFPGIQIKPEQELCLESLVVKRKDVLGVLPTGYGKSLIYQLLPKLMSEYWFLKTGTKKTISVLVVSPLELIRRQQVERLVDFELRLKYLIRRALYLGYRIRVAVDWFVRQYI